MRKERVKRLQLFAQSCRFDFSSKILDPFFFQSSFLSLEPIHIAL